MAKRVLAIGLDPKFADFSQFPHLTPALIGAFIDAQLARVRELGYEVDSCLVDLGETADRVVTKSLEAKEYDCVMIGAGLSAAQHLLLFEKILNLVHERAPRARLCFNTSPADTAEAVRRWI